MVARQELGAVAGELPVKEMKKALIVFQKKPEPGKVKTRLAKDIGEEKAMEVYKYLLDHTHKQAQKSGADVFVYFQGGIDADYGVFAKYFLAHQIEGDLGKKMEAAFNEVFSYGYQEVLIIGSDCQELTSDIIAQAFDSLTNHDLVIGPALDGGYYLLGMKKLHAPLFRNKPWSTPAIYELTSNEANSMGLVTHVLPTLSDVDVVDDLGKLKEIFDIP